MELQGFNKNPNCRHDTGGVSLGSAQLRLFQFTRRIEHEDFTITGYAENLFDSTYYTNAYQKAFAGGLFAEPSMRSYGIRVRYTYGE